MPLAKRKVNGELQFCIPSELWRCPKCGAGSDSPKGGFVLDEPFSDPGEDSQDIPEEEEAQGWTRNGCVICECGYDTTTAKFFTLLMKKANMVECPCCKGHGVVSSKKANETSLP